MGRHSKSTAGEVEAPPLPIERRPARGATDTYADVADGGLHAWIIVVASFLTNGIIFGIHNCYGIIYLSLKSELEQAGVADAATKSCKLFCHL